MIIFEGEWSAPSFSILPSPLLILLRGRGGVFCVYFEGRVCPLPLQSVLMFLEGVGGVGVVALLPFPLPSPPFPSYPFSSLPYMPLRVGTFQHVF